MSRKPPPIPPPLPNIQQESRRIPVVMIAGIGCCGLTVMFLLCGVVGLLIPKAAAPNVATSDSHDRNQATSAEVVINNGIALSNPVQLNSHSLPITQALESWRVKENIANSVFNPEIKVFIFTAKKFGIALPNSTPNSKGTKSQVFREHPKVKPADIKSIPEQIFLIVSFRSVGNLYRFDTNSRRFEDVCPLFLKRSSSEANPALTGKVTGAVNGETFTYSVSLSLDGKTESTIDKLRKSVTNQADGAQLVLEMFEQYVGKTGQVAVQ